MGLVVNGIATATPAGNAAGLLGVPDGLDQDPGFDTLDPAPSAPPFAPLMPIEADFVQAYGTTEFARQQALKADSFIAKLGELAAGLVPPTINPQFPTNLNPPTISTPAAPDLLPITYTPPSVPQPLLDQLTITDIFPDFDADAPSLIFPNAPIQANPNLPTSPTIDTNFVYPDVDVTLPTSPDLLSIQIAKFDGVTFPVFDAEAPTLTLAQPQITNYVPGAPYTDALLSGLVGELQSRLAIGVTGKNTGLPAAVEQNLWQRGRERELRARADAILNLEKMENMGYALPSGAFIDGRIKIETELRASEQGLSREVMIKQAELEQANISKAIDAATQIESKLIDYANLTEQRRFDAAKYATEAAVQLYNAGVQAFTARVQAYKGFVDAYVGQLQAAKTKVEIYQAQIEAEKLKSSINTDRIQQYKVSVDAALASIEVFKGQIQVIQTRAQIEQLKVSIFGEQIKAYTAQVSAYGAQVEAYRATISAEQAKVTTYQTQAQVYGTLVDATSKEISAKIEGYKAKVTAKQAEYQAYTAQVQGAAEQTRALAAADTAIADIYRAKVQGSASYNDSLTKQYQASIEISARIAEIGVQAAQANGQLYISARGIAADAAKVGAQVESQIAASALGTVTWSTQRSRHDNVSQGTSLSFGNSKSQSSSSSQSSGLNQNFNSSTQTSTSASSSVSKSDSTVHNIQSVE